MHQWFAEFSRSKHFEQLSEDQKQESEFIIETLSEFMYSHHGLPPHQWNAMELEECCLETLPRKVSTDEIYFQSIAPVLCAFFAFAGKRNLLKNASTLAKTVTAIDKQIVKNASDPKHWGISKSLVKTAEDAGVDVMDEDEFQQFITRYNADIPSQPGAKPRHVSQKPGRNEPCPCGSGKKYKKCCGR